MSLPPVFDPQPDFHDRIAAALREDLSGRGDVTSDAVFDAEHRSRAVIRAKQAGVFCGAPVADAVFRAVDDGIAVVWQAAEGARVERGEVVARLTGPTRCLLAAERTALNFLQRLGGIATLTAAYVAAAGAKCAVCDTRKTTPLWRDVEKYAVACGGGVNHRFGLFDMVMLKDTHADGAGGLASALERVAPLRPGLKVAAEARGMDEVRAAVEARVDLLMLDNMGAGELRAALAEIGGRVPVEITGGVTLETIGDFAALGVDRISIGALTHSAPALDLSLRLDLGITD